MRYIIITLLLFSCAEEVIEPQVIEEPEEILNPHCERMESNDYDLYDDIDSIKLFIDDEFLFCSTNRKIYRYLDSLNCYNVIKDNWSASWGEPCSE